jgi:hypothetical protein
MKDLLIIHQEKIREGKLSLPPAKWCMINPFSLLLDIHIDEKPHPFKIKGSPSHGLRGVPKAELYKEQFGEYLAISELADKYREFSPDRYQIEECYRAVYMFNYPEAIPEQYTPVGRIDCITESEIVEIKNIRSWKAGLGQLLAYAYFYPSHHKVLMVFGKMSIKYNDNVKSVCEKYDVELRVC